MEFSEKLRPVDEER